MTAGATPRAVVVTSSPITPNGDLHLGHLAGPYLGADIHVRYLRLRGIPAYHVTGSDDFQSYVAGFAARSGTTPAATADQFGGCIEAALAAADVHPDQFTRPLRLPAYADEVVRFLNVVREGGLLVDKDTEGLFCVNCDRYRFEFGVRGRCPSCGKRCAGNACEDCGRPNSCIDLIEPVCTDCGEPPVIRRWRRLVVELDKHAQTVKEHLNQSVISSRFRALADGMIADGLPELAVTHPFDWGIPADGVGIPQQIVWAWLDMGLSYLIGLRELGRRMAWEVRSDSLTPHDDIDLVQFFGFDNAYYHIVLYPLLYRAYAPDWRPSMTFVGNEFYCLDGRKFSTSRRHALWAGEVLGRTSSDLIRYYLSLTRPETEQTNFTWGEFEGAVERNLRGQWQGWLSELGRRARASSEGPAPDDATDDHRRFFAELAASARVVAAAYEASTFSPQRAVRELGEIVRRARRFGQSEEHRNGVGRRRREFRNAVWVELSAARALAVLSSPIMPRFAAALWADLGCAGSVQANGWENVPGTLAPGSRVGLRPHYF